MDDKQQADILGQAQTAQESWGLILDMLDGMLAETMRRGWPEEMARAIVARAFIPDGG